MQTETQPSTVSKLNKVVNDRPMHYTPGQKCPICGDGELSKHISRETFTYEAFSFTIEEYLTYKCNKCKEQLVPQETFDKTSPRLRRWIDSIKNSKEDWTSKMSSRI